MGARKALQSLDAVPRMRAPYLVPHPLAGLMGDVLSLCECEALLRGTNEPVADEPVERRFDRRHRKAG